MIAALLVVVLVFPASVCAAGLSRPIVLSTVLGTEEAGDAQFAINDSGQAVVAYPSFGDGMPVVVVARLARDGKLRNRQIVGLPAKSVSSEGGEAGAAPLDLALADDDQVALVDTNYDACCDSVGISTWMLGARPPVLDELSPQTTELQVIQTPRVAVDDRGHLFAAWVTEQTSTFSVQAARATNAGYAVQTIYLPPESQFGIEQFGIQQTGSGQPVLNWVNALGPTYAFAATTGRGGLWGAARRGAVPSFSPVNLGNSTGFATDTAGNQALIYEHELVEGQLWMVHRAAGHAFGDPRRIGGASDNTTIAAGGHETLFVARVPHRQNNVIVEVGKTLGRLGPAQRFEADIPYELHAAVDDRGRAILVWEAQRRGTHGKSKSGIWLTTAGASGRFGRPVLVSNPRQTCAFEGSENPIVQSPTGRALISWTCGPEEHQTRYMARYTP